LFEGGFEVVGDFLSDDFGRGQIGGFFQGIILEPEDVEVDFVALEQFVVGETFETLAFLPLVTVPGVVAFHEVVEIGALEGRATWASRVFLLENV
jgi:hypothetical protein